jgi:hypothetical protein
VEESRSYFNKKIPIKFRGIPNITAMVEEDISVFVPQQLSLLQSKSKAIMDSLVTKQPYLAKYLSDQFLNQVLASVYTSNKRKYVENLSLSEYLEAQSSGTSFVQIALPCLLGFCFNFNQQNSLVMADAVKWVFLEEVLKNISLLHQINQNQKFESFLYASTMSEKEEFDWMQMSQKSKLQKLMANNEIKEIAHAQKTKIYNSALQSLSNLSLPDNHREMLRELLDWAKMVYVGS